MVSTGMRFLSGHETGATPAAPSRKGDFLLSRRQRLAEPSGPSGRILVRSRWLPDPPFSCTFTGWIPIPARVPPSPRCPFPPLPHHVSHPQPHVIPTPLQHPITTIAFIAVSGGLPTVLPVVQLRAGRGTAGTKAPTVPLAAHFSLHEPPESFASSRCHRPCLTCNK